MSPNIMTSNNKMRINVQDNKNKEIKKTIFEYQNFIKKNFKYVGKNFAYEARSMHYQNKKNLKGIYGSATSKDLKDLREEGIETEMIPWIEDSTN